MSLTHWWFKVPLKVRSLFMRSRVQKELDEELQFHIDCKVEEGLAQGLSTEEARYRALRAMGGLAEAREAMRDAQGVHWFTDFADDMQYALRSLRRTPALTGFIVLTLALGIGMAATPFSMLDALVFRPYPVPEPGRVVSLVGTSRDKSVDAFSYREYLDIRERTKSYEGVVANRSLVGMALAAAPGATPRIKAGMLVSGNYFRVLGVVPQIGRDFRDDEDEAPGRDAVAMLGPDVFRTDFGSDPNVVGKTVRLNGADFTVIGVLPDSFPGLMIFGRPDVYVPLAMSHLFSTNPRESFFEDRDVRELVVRARLKTGATVAEAQSELALLARTFEKDYPKTNRSRGAAVRTQFEMRTQADDGNWKFGVIFTVLALAVLLVACTNVAGLLLSRARTRTREIAVRLALGAGRFRLVRLLLTESLILACLGGAGGIAVGSVGISLLRRFRIPSELPVQIPFRMDARVVLACLALAVVSAVACGLAPALQSTRVDLVNGLKTADVDVPGKKRLWGRNLLVVAQVAASLMLLTAVFLMQRGFAQGIADKTRFTTKNVLMARFDPRLVQYDAVQTRRFYEELVSRARALPGVESVALSRSVPLGLEAFESVKFAPEDVEMPRDRETVSAAMDTIDEGFFTTLAIPILRGRGFLASDTAESRRVAVVNEQLARHYWPHADAVGKRLRIGGRTGEAVEIVGVAQTMKYRGTMEAPTDFVYLPVSQHPVPRMLLLLRTAGSPLALVDPVKRVVRSLDANLPISETRTYEDIYRYHTVEGPGVAVNLIATMGIVALFLAVAGLYGVIAYTVARRTREIGVRMAIGASPADVLRLVMGKGCSLVATGTAVGLVLGFALERAMNAFLFNAGGVDVLAYAVVVPSLFLVTMLAAYIPARKASRIAPTVALRYE
jgi:putative ABC transport system permease protein